jgi:hypothetical protein
MSAQGDISSAVSQDPHAQLTVIRAFIGALMEREDEDRQLILEGVEQMLGDIQDTGSLQPLEHYVAHYTVSDPQDVAGIAENIRIYGMEL